MKKVFMILATLAVASMTLVGCKKDEGNKGKDDPKDDPDVPVVEAFEVAIDGDFSDWAALTADKATENDVIFDGLDGAIKAMKATSDESCVYLYAEIAIDKVQQSAVAAEGGNSNEGHGDSTPGPFTIYWDLDNNAGTGFLCQHSATGDLLVEGVGCEVGSEMYLFIDTKDSKCKLGWSQLVYEPDEAQDGDLYQADWGSDTSNPQYGWDPDMDNLAPMLDSYQTKVGSVLQIEWAVEKNTLAGLCKRGHDMGKTITIGASWNNGGSDASFVYGTGVAGPATIALR